MWVASGSIPTGIINTSPRFTSRKASRKYFCNPPRSEAPLESPEPEGDFTRATVTVRAVGSGGGRGPNELAMMETERTPDPGGMLPRLYKRAGSLTASPLRKFTHRPHPRRGMRHTVRGGRPDRQQL